MASYPSSMTDSEWAILETLLPPQPDTLRGRPQEHSRRSIIDGILYITQTVGAWWMIANDLPHRETCYHYFRLRAMLGHWERIHHAIPDMACLSDGKKPRLLRLS